MTHAPEPGDISCVCGKPFLMCYQRQAREATVMMMLMMGLGFICGLLWWA